MSQAFDDGGMRAAMTAYLDAARRLDEAAGSPDTRAVLDLAEAKSLAGLSMRRRLIELGWTPPGRDDGVPQVATEQEVRP